MGFTIPATPTKKAPRLPEGISDPAEARTQDPQIKSLLLYQLSYGVVVLFGLQINGFFLKISDWRLVICDQTGVF